MELRRKLSSADLVSACVGAALVFAVILALKSAVNPHNHFALFVLISYIPAILLHELAHAVAVSALGETVNRIKLGVTTHPTGSHWSFRFLGFPWEIYNVPLTGAVFSHQMNPNGYRSRRIMIAAAGPLVSLAAAGLGWGLFWNRAGSDSAMPSLGWAAVNSYIFLATAIPMKRNLMGSVSQTDGQLILNALALSGEEIEQRCLLAKIQQDSSSEKEIVGRLSIDEAIARYEANPERLATLGYLINKLNAAKDSRKHEYTVRFVTDDRLPSALAIAHVDGYLTDCLNEGTITPNDLFDQLSEKLLIMSDHSITARGTRGSVLIDLGRVEEGRAILKEVLVETQSPMDRVYGNIFLALADKHDGDLAGARRHARLAAELDPEHVALKRIADLLGKPAAG